MVDVRSIPFEVRAEVAWAYVEVALERGPFLSQRVREVIDPHSGVFEATADFAIGPEGEWSITTEGTRQNRYADSSSEQGWRWAPRKPLIERVLPALRSPGRLLIVEQAITDGPRWTPGFPHSGVRSVQRLAERGYESYLLVAGPAEEPAVDFAISLWGGLWKEFGVVVDIASDPLPADHSLIDEAVLSRLAKDVVGFFLRFTSYDGYLMWWRDDRQGK